MNSAPLTTLSLCPRPQRAAPRPEFAGRPGRKGPADLHWEVVAAPADAQACFALRAAEYGRYYRNIPADQFADDFDTATTAAGEAATHLIAVKAGADVVGTCRLTLSRHWRHPGLRSEIAELTDVSWADLAARNQTPAGPMVVGELGKFAVSRASDVRRVKWMLLSATGHVAARAGMAVVIALMPPLVERAARHAGVHFHGIPSAKLRRDCSLAKGILLRYPDYFLPALRKCEPRIDLTQIDVIDPAVLDTLLAAIPDGPKLWHITPAELATAVFPSDES